MLEMIDFPQLFLSLKPSILEVFWITETELSVHATLRG